MSHSQPEYVSSHGPRASQFTGRFNPSETSRANNLTDAEYAHQNVPLSRSTGSLAFPQSATVLNLAAGKHRGGHGRSSRTWTASSGDICLLSDTDELEDRAVFVMEYNRLAKKVTVEPYDESLDNDVAVVEDLLINEKHGVRVLVVEDFENSSTVSPEKPGWLQRLLRSTSSNPSGPAQAAAAQRVPHKRSVSDVAHYLANRKEPPRTVDLQTMVRLSGKSVLYLPTEHAAGALVLPTCIRATAQHLAHHAMTRGIFRIPGSTRVVNALFNYYCYVEGDNAGLAGTVRCANLPLHIQSSVHDVASTFKRMLSVLPGGILGSLAVFDAMVAIHSQLQGDPEFPRTKQTKVRARLMALAIATIKSHFRRELICAVFGLLSLIGRIAEVTPREDESGRPLPTADLMGYSALGIVFGPLLVGDLLDCYTMKIANPGTGLMLFPVTPQHLRKERRKSKARSTGVPPAQTNVNKILVANSIAEMLLTNWRDVVRQLRAMGVHSRRDMSLTSMQTGPLRPSASDTFVIKKPQDWESSQVQASAQQSTRDASPSTQSVTLKRQRAGHKKNAASASLAVRPTGTLLSPTLEEVASANESGKYSHGNAGTSRDDVPSVTRSIQATYIHKPLDDLNRTEVPSPNAQNPKRESDDSQRGSAAMYARRKTPHSSPQLSRSLVPPRTSSRPRASYSSVPSSSGRQQTLLADKQADSQPRQLSNEVTRGRRGVSSSAQLSETAELDATPVPIKRRTRPTPRPGPRISTASKSESKPSELRIEPPSETLEHTDLYDADDDTTTTTTTIGDATLEQLSMAELESLSRLEMLQDQGDNRSSQATVQGDHEYFFLSEEGHIERHRRARSPEQINESSLAAMSRHSYAPLDTPSNISAQHAEHFDKDQATSSRLQKEFSMTSHSKLPVSKTRQQSAVSHAVTPRKPSISASHLPNQHGGSHTSSETPLSFADKLGKFDASAAAKAAAQVAKQRQSKTVRPSVSAAASNAGAVKSMAARFETDSPMPELADNVQDSIKRSRPFSTFEPSQSRATTHRYSKSGPPDVNVDHSSLVSKDDNGAKGLEAPKAGAFGKDVDRVAASPAIKLHPTSPHGKPEPVTPSSQETKRQPGRLGPMIPPQEQPPVAQHLNLARPSSTVPTMFTLENSAWDDGESFTSLTPRPGSTTYLHSQIRNLQRQLLVRTEEAMQLRRQLEAQEGTDLGTLSEKLREATREVAMWKERAEAAERRVKVFEKFTSRLRGIRVAAGVAEGQDHAEEPDRINRTSSDEEEEIYRLGSNDENISPAQHITSPKGRKAIRNSTASGSSDSGRTEDPCVVNARIKKCLLGGETGGDGANDYLEEGSPAHESDQDPRLPKSNALGRGTCHKRVSHEVGWRETSAGEIWMAAQELLEMEDEDA